MADKKRAPVMRPSYGGEPLWFWERGQRPMKTPEPSTVRVTKALPSRAGLTPADLMERINDFAASHGVDPSTVRISLNDWSSAHLWTDRPETDAEYDRRLKRVHTHNRALAQYKADLQAVLEWRAEHAKAQEAKEAKRDAAVQVAAKAELVAEAKQNIRNNARAMRAITDEILTDEQFIKSLKKLFTS